MDPHSNPIAPEPDRAVRALSYMLVHGIYWKLLVWPTFLCYDYSFDAIPLVREIADVRLLLSIAAYLSLSLLLCLSLDALRPASLPSAAAALDAGGRAPAAATGTARRAPVVGLAILLLSFLPMSNVFFPVGTMVGERLLYIPSAGLLIALVGLGHLFHSRGRGPLRHASAALLLAAGAAAAWLCAARVGDWASPEAVTVADGLKQLRSARVQFNYGNVHLAAKRYDEALATYEHVISIDPTDRDSLPLYHAGQILIYKGRHKEAERYLARAIAGYFSPLTIKEEEIWHDYGLALWFVQDINGSITNFKNALIINPTFTKALNNLGCAEGLGAVTGVLPGSAIQDSVGSLALALQLDPTNVLYWRNMAAMLHLGGNGEGSAEAWRRLREVQPMAAPADEGGPPEDCAWEFGFR